MALALLLTNPALGGQLIWAALPLIGALLAGALILYVIDRWRKRVAEDEEAACAPNDQLSHFRTLYERGEMSREEFEKVKALLAGQLRREMNVPGPAPTPAPPPLVGGGVGEGGSAPAETNVQAAPPDRQSPPPPDGQPG
jgi:hypothetical protein